MEYSEAKKKIEAAYQIFTASSTTKAKFENARSLIQGINPKLDKLLSQCSKEISHWDKLTKGEVIDLIAENLPELTPEQKKKKRALLAILSFWKQLQTEVVRVQKELDSAIERGDTSFGQQSAWKKIASGAKGPLGLATIVAVGLVALNATSTTITIKNNGCETFYPKTTVPINLPGLSLPNNPIPSGSSATAVIPPLSLTVDARTPGTLKLAALNLNFSFSLNSNTIFIFDGKTLNNQTTVVHLNEKKQHELVISCR